MSRKGASPIEEFLADLAARQHGVVAWWQIEAAGHTRCLVDTRLQAKRLHTVHRGVYAVGHPTVTPRGRWMAAVLALGAVAVLSHWSAAWLWGFAQGGGALIDVTVPGRGGRQRRKGVRVHHAAEVERAVRDGIPVTTPARTLLDLAAVAPQRVVDRAVDAAERERLFDLEAIRALPLNGHRGAKKLRAAIAKWDGAPTDEELERRFLELCVERGLPRPLSQAAVAGFACDFVWPHHRLVVELDGRHHLTRRQQLLDREKEAALILAGYRVHRFVWQQVVRRPDEVEATMRVLLSGRSSRGPSAPARR